MQCSSNVPVHYHARELNVGASGFTWQHPYNSDANSGEERGCNVFVPQCTMGQYLLGYHKEAVGKIMQNHEATFRYQVRELHRLYRRQRELVDGTRVGENFIPQYQSQISNYFSSQVRYEISQSKPRTTSLILGDCSDSKLSVLTSENIQQPPSFVVKNFLEPGADIFNEVKILSSSSRNKRHDEKRVFDLELPPDVYNDDDDEEVEQFEKLGSVKTWDSSHVNICSKKRNFLFDLNEPTELDSPVIIDLNSLPDSSLMEDIVIEHQKLLKINNYIDLNISVVFDDPSPQLSCTNLGIECAGKEIDLEGPVRPENEEGFPPRGSVEEIQLKIPQEPSLELDKAAAETLMQISSSCLYWFAEILSATGDDLENELMKLKNDTHKENKGQHKVFQSEFLLALASPSKDTIEASRKREARRTISFAKRRKCSKLSSFDCIKKSTSSILKQIAACNTQGVLQAWGKIEKRQGVCRRPATKFLLK